jgi:hypothetical protein
VTPRYFETTGITITRGRAIDERDGADAEKVAVVSEAMAQLFWPEAEPLGRCLLVNRSTECTRVIGVAENAARGGYRDQPAGAYYLPMTQGPNSTLQAPNGLYIRARGSVSETQETLTGALRSLPAPVRWVRVMSLQDMLDPQARSWTLGATMFTVFGGLALLLAAIGLYSVLAFDVAQRTRELGIRSALGAQRGRLMRSVLYRGASMGGLGIALGLTVAYLAAPYAADLLFEVSPRDPGVLALSSVSSRARLCRTWRSISMDCSQRRPAKLASSRDGIKNRDDVLARQQNRTCNRGCLRDRRDHSRHLRQGWSACFCRGLQ